MDERRRGRPPKQETVGMYLNRSKVKCHTSKGSVFPDQRVELDESEAKVFGDRLVRVQ